MGWGRPRGATNRRHSRKPITSFGHGRARRSPRLLVLHTTLLNLHYFDSHGATISHASGDQVLNPTTPDQITTSNPTPTGEPKRHYGWNWSQKLLHEAQTARGKKNRSKPERMANPHKRIDPNRFRRDPEAEI